MRDKHVTAAVGVVYGTAAPFLSSFGMGLDEDKDRLYLYG